MSAPAPAQAPARGRAEIVARLFGLFRETGYAGASLSAIAEATGLRRPSLYHHFPGGKAQMAAAVAEAAREGLETHVLAGLAGDDGRVARVGRMLDAVRGLYGGGRQPCVAASMLVGDAPAAATAEIGRLVRLWIDRVAATLVDTGAAEPAARRAAVDALARIQGALIVARALDDPGVFDAALDDVAASLAAVP